MVISIFAILLLLIVLGGGCALVLGLIAIAAKNKRPGTALLVGGLSFLGLLIGAAVLISVIAYFATRSAHVKVPDWADGPAHEVAQIAIDGMQHVNDHSQVSHHSTWKMSIGGLLFIVLVIGALLAVAARRAFSHSAAGGHGRIWPAFVAVPLLGFFLIGSVRVQRSVTHGPGAHVVSPQAEHVHSLIHVQRDEIANSSATIETEVQKNIATMDIHELMDKVDAPRIQLQSQVAPLPTAAMPVDPAIYAGLAAAMEEVLDAYAASATADTPEKTTASSDKPQGKSKSETIAKPAAVETASSSKSEPDKKVAVAPVDEDAKDPAIVAASPPAWVTNPPKRIGELQREVIVTDEWSSDEECERARNVALMLKTYDRIQRFAIHPNQGYMPDQTEWSDFRLRQLASMGITVDYVLREIAKDEYVETVERSVGPMKKIYTLVEFSPAVDRELRRRWEGRERRERFAMVSVGAGSILGLLVLVFGLLKVDTWTKGYYTKRLFIGVPAAIIGGFLLLLFWDIVT